MDDKHGARHTRSCSLQEEKTWISRLGENKSIEDVYFFLNGDVLNKMAFGSGAEMTGEGKDLSMLNPLMDSEEVWSGFDADGPANGAFPLPIP